VNEKQFTGRRALAAGIPDSRDGAGAAKAEHHFHAPQA